MHPRNSIPSASRSARFHGSMARFKGFSGPIGSGKSQALCEEAIKLSYQTRKSGVAGSADLPDVTGRDAKRAVRDLESNKIPYDHNKGENTVVMRDTRSKMLFRAVDEYERLRERTWRGSEWTS